MTESLVARAALDRMLIRDVVENYLVALDAQDWEGIAACFTDDATSRYNNEPQLLHGGQGVAEFLHRMTAYSATNHTLCSISVKLAGDTAVARFKTLATLHVGEVGAGRVQVRSVSFLDKFRRAGDGWLIYERLHRPDFQYDAVSQPTLLH